MTTGLQFFIGWWFRKAAVFYLPPGWFGPLTWWLALPFAPAGSVSCGVWQMACRRVIKVGERVVREVMSPTPGSDSGKSWSSRVLYSLCGVPSAEGSGRPVRVLCLASGGGRSRSRVFASQRSGRSRAWRVERGRGEEVILDAGVDGQAHFPTELVWIGAEADLDCLACFGAVFGLGGPASRVADLGFRGSGSASEQERKATAGVAEAQGAEKKSE